MEKTQDQASVQVSVGLDYHARSVQVCVVGADLTVLRNVRCGNSVCEIAHALRPEWRVKRVAIESCCGAADLAEALAAELRWPVTLAHPGYANRMKCNPDKSDHSDARMLAELACVGMIPPVWLAPAPIRELRLLVRLRADLVERVRALKTRVLSVLRLQRIPEPTRQEIGGRWTDKWLRWLRSDAAAISPQGRFVVEMHLDELTELKKRTRSVETQLEGLTRDDPVVTRLLQIKGVGPVTAWTMRAVIGRFDRFATGKQLARFCGLSPRNASSGERMADAGLIKAGDALLKGVLIEAAHRLRRWDPRWKELSMRLEQRGKKVPVAVAAVANRWVRSLHHQMTKEEPAMAA